MALWLGLGCGLGLVLGLGVIVLEPPPPSRTQYIYTSLRRLRDKKQTLIKNQLKENGETCRNRKTSKSDERISVPSKQKQPFADVLQNRCF